MQSAITIAHLQFPLGKNIRTANTPRLNFYSVKMLQSKFLAQNMILVINSHTAKLQSGKIFVSKFPCFKIFGWQNFRLWNLQRQNTQFGDVLVANLPAILALLKLSPTKIHAEKWKKKQFLHIYSYTYILEKSSWRYSWDTVHYSLNTYLISDFTRKFESDFEIT